MFDLMVVGLKDILGILFIREQDVGFTFIIFFIFGSCSSNTYSDQNFR